jgi:hypothetical protein
VCMLSPALHACAPLSRPASAAPLLQAKPLPLQPNVLKLVRTRGASWQTPRPPFDVTFECALAGAQPDCDASGAALAWTTHSLAMGAGAVPEKVEAALQSMPEGEAATFVLAREHVAGGSAPRGFPAPPPGAALCALHIRMVSFVEVRDITGDGRVRAAHARAGHASCGSKCRQPCRHVAGGGSRGPTRRVLRAHAPRAGCSAFSRACTW